MLIEKDILEKQNIKSRSYKMAHYKWKNKVTDDLEDAKDNLKRAQQKIESARYYVDRE